MELAQAPLVGELPGGLVQGGGVLGEPRYVGEQQVRGAAVQREGDTLGVEVACVEVRPAGFAPYLGQVGEAAAVVAVASVGDERLGVAAEGADVRVESVEAVEVFHLYRPRRDCSAARLQAPEWAGAAG